MNDKRISRRNFITRSIRGAIGTGVVLSGNQLLATSPSVNSEELISEERLKIGIIGCGNRSSNHINAINQIPEFEITALCDLVPEKMEDRKKMIKRGSPRTYTDFEEMVLQNDLDGVVVVLPNYLHKDATVDALQANNHVLCEKPMALNVKECNAMITNAERQNKGLQIGTQRRHSTTFNQAIDKIRQEDVGKFLSSDINTYRGDWAVLSPDPKKDSKINWRMDVNKVGGVEFEQGAHTIDLNNWIIDSDLRK